jgi:hypothetical protein
MCIVVMDFNPFYVCKIANLVGLLAMDGLKSIPQKFVEQRALFGRDDKIRMNGLCSKLKI